MRRDWVQSGRGGCRVLVPSLLRRRRVLVNNKLRTSGCGGGVAEFRCCASPDVDVDLDN